MNGWMLAVTSTEGTERGEIAVGQGSAIDTLDDVGLGLLGLLEEELADVFWKLPFEYIAHQTFPHVGSTAFVAQNVTKRGDARMEAATVVVAGIAACAENADDASLMSAKTPCRTEHVTLYMNVGCGAEDLAQGFSHNGSLLWCASCSVEVNGREGWCE